MKEFAQLFYSLDQADSNPDKINILSEYFKNVPHEDILWALALFSGQRPKRTLTNKRMQEWVAEYSGIPAWLLGECEDIVGDKNETMSLILPEAKTEKDESLAYWIRYLTELKDKADEEKKEAVFTAWNCMGQKEKFIFGKLASATFRTNITQNVMVRALSKFTGIDIATLTQRLNGKWDAEKTSFEELILNANNLEDISKPYPFFLAHSIGKDLNELGLPNEWLAEWKWDGIRVQIITRHGQLFIWNKNDELVTDKFPELEALKSKLSDGCVIDVETLPFVNGKVLPFSILQTRLARKKLSAKIFKEAQVSFFAFDLLEYNGIDIREKPLDERRELLKKLIEEVNAKPILQISPEISFNSWEELAAKKLQAREYAADGIILKRRSSAYLNGKPNDWQTWKTDPLSIDGILIYAAQGTGRHANLFTEYTFGVWQGNELVTFAKTNTGLSNREIIELDNWIKKNMMEKFGPVRTVKPALVFEIGFEAIQPSSRHKSGAVLRAPHILRWRTDKKAEDAGTLAELKAIMGSLNNL